MYTMQEVCRRTGLKYETLKYYCNQGLILNVNRDHNNYRIFNENNLNWIDDLICLKRCNMSISEIKSYLELCLEGIDSVPTRQEILKRKQETLENKIKTLKDSIQYIHHKQKLYEGFLDGSIAYKSNLIDDK